MRDTQPPGTPRHSKLVVMLGLIPAIFLGAALLSLALLGWRFHADAAKQQSVAAALVAGVGFGLQAYEDAKGRFPPPYVNDQEGRASHSWRVLILPYLGREDLCYEYRFHEPWDGQHNRKLIPRIPQEYRWPYEPDGDLRAHCLMVTGEGTASPPGRNVAREEITDGVGRTAVALLVEKSDILWSEPRDITLDEAVAALDGKGKFRIKFFLSGMTYFVMRDGSVCRVRRNSLTPQRLRALFTINGNEDMRWFSEQQ